MLAERSRNAIFHLVNTLAEIENAIEKLPTELEWRGKPLSLRRHKYARGLAKIIRRPLRK